MCTYVRTYTHTYIHILILVLLSKLYIRYVLVQSDLNRKYVRTYLRTLKGAPKSVLLLDVLTISTGLHSTHELRTE